MLWHSDEWFLLPCLNAQPDSFAVMNCCVVALSVFSSDILTWGTDILVYVQCQGRTQGGLGLNFPLKLDILQKLDYLRKRHELFLHTFCMLICRLNANNMEWICMQISRSILNGPENNDQVSLGIWVVVWVQKTFHHFLQTFRLLGSTFLRLCSAVVHFIRNNCIYLVC